MRKDLNFGDNSRKRKIAFSVIALILLAILAMKLGNFGITGQAIAEGDGVEISEDNSNSGLDILDFGDSGVDEEGNQGTLQDQTQSDARLLRATNSRSSNECRIDLSDAEEEIDEIRNALSKKRNELYDLINNLNSILGTTNGLESDYDEASTNAEQFAALAQQLQEQLNELLGEINGLESAIENREDDVDELEDELDNAQDYLLELKNQCN